MRAYPGVVKEELVLRSAKPTPKRAMPVLQHNFGTTLGSHLDDALRACIAVCQET
jgi:hypothetical protein